MSDYLNCHHCRKPMNHVDVVAIQLGKGQFEFAHRVDCAKAVRNGIEVYQLKIEDITESSR